MKILSSDQVRAVDQHTIESEPISSIELMERAAEACTRRIIELATPGDEFDVYCGMGNNGGDGLAIARLLLENNFRSRTWLVKFRDKLSPDAEENLRRLQKDYPATIKEIQDSSGLENPSNGKRRIAIDALLGTGITGSKNELLTACIKHINKSYDRIISVDVPSGLLPDGRQEGQEIVKASLTLTFGSPKLAFLSPKMPLT